MMRPLSKLELNKLLQGIPLAKDKILACNILSESIILKIFFLLSSTTKESEPVNLSPTSLENHTINWYEHGFNPH